jgi:hypothetical protein
MKTFFSIIFGVALACCASALGMLGGCVKKPEPPPPENVGDPNASVKKTNEVIRGNLRAIRERLSAARSEYKLNADIGSDLLGATEELLKLSGTARDDCDRMIRAADDIRWDLPRAAIGYKANADRCRLDAERTNDERMRGIHLQTAAMMDRYAAEVPRRMKVTEEFLASAKQTRALLAESERTLRVQWEAMVIGTTGAEKPAVRIETKVYMAQFEQFLSVVERFYREFGEPPPVVASPAAPPQG